MCYYAICALGMWTERQWENTMKTFRNLALALSAAALLTTSGPVAAAAQKGGKPAPVVVEKKRVECRQTRRGYGSGARPGNILMPAVQGRCR